MKVDSINEVEYLELVKDAIREGVKEAFIQMMKRNHDCAQARDDICKAIECGTEAALEGRVGKKPS